MPRINTMITSFLKGEVSPRWLARTQDPQYQQALKSLINAIPVPQGGVQKRAGSQYQEVTLGNIFETATPSNKYDAVDFRTLYAQSFRLIPYNLSNGENYWLVLHTGEARNWSWYNPTSETLIPFLSHVEDVVGDNTWTNNMSLAQITISVGGLDLGIAGIDLQELQYQQSGDVLFLTHRFMPPLTIRYLPLVSYSSSDSATSIPIASAWFTAFMPFATTFADNTEFHEVIPFLEPNQNNNYGQGSLSYPAAAYTIGNTLTVTFSQPIAARYIRSFIRVTNLGSNLSACLYGSAPINSSQIIMRFVSGTMPAGGVNYGTATNTYWEEAAWSEINGYPRGVFAYNNRIGYLGTNRNPNRIWFSAVGDVDELNELPYAQDPEFSTYLNDNSRAFSIDVLDADQLLWASPGKRLFLGAANKEFVMFSDTNEFGPDSYNIDTATTNGSTLRQPVRVGSEMIFTQRSGTRLRNILFSFQEDDYRSTDLSKDAEHIARKSQSNIEEEFQSVPKFGSLLLQTSPDTRLWVTDNNGGLSCCTIDRENNTIAWATHVLGGTPIGSTYGVNSPIVASAILVPSYDKETDEVVMLVKRKVNGQDKVFLEKIGGYFNENTYTHSGFSPLAGFPDYLRTRPVFMDCCQGSVSASPTTTFTFADFPNETLSVVADGDYLGEYTLNGSGVLTLERAYREVLVGYKYSTKVVPVQFELPNTPATTQAAYKQLTELTLRLHKSDWCKVRKEGQADYQSLQTVFDSEANDSAIELFTGDIRANISGTSRALSAEILHDRPLPFELLGLIMRIEVT